MRDSFISNLHARELSSRSGRLSRNYRNLYTSRHLIDELDITHELGGHSGCVNALSWSKGGDLLASGSDDQHLNIHRYQPADDSRQFQLSATIATGHTQNIFSVKFMPHSNDSIVVTAAGDGEVRVFDIAHTGQTSEASRASRMASEGRRRGRNSIYKGVTYLTDGNTDCRVYRSHGDRVKRIVTESSPHLFLTCSEDGEVRQWDMRQPSSAYPRPRGGRFTTQDASLPPPLISYRKYGLDLNSISCSASQPHYIALGGSHLHAFLHDRRMTGRDVLAEAGKPLSPISQMSPAEQELMGQATQCVRKFAPKGQKNMKRAENGHITALKISDARPDEMIVSWSGDHIYSFDLIRESPAKGSQGAAERHHQRKRKRHATGSESASASTRQRTQQNSLRIRYQNGQSEDIPLHSDTDQGPPFTSRRSDSQRIAKAVVRIRASLFDPDEPSSHPTARFVTCTDHAASIISDMDEVMREWSYPLDPEPDQVYVQQTLRRNRERCRRFVQAAGTLSRVLGERPQTPTLPGTSLIVIHFTEIEIRNNDLELTAKEKFGHDFIKAILLWLESGVGRLIEGFTRPEQTTRKAGSRLPIPEADATVEAIDEYLIPYLYGLAGDEPIVNLDTNQFEVDSNQVVFTEKEAVQAFAEAVKMPFADLSAGVMEAGGEEYIQMQDRQAARGFWARKIARGILLRVAEGLNHEFVDRAFGGLGRVMRETSGGESRLGMLGEDDEGEDNVHLRSAEVIDEYGGILDRANAEDIAAAAQAAADDDDDDDDGDDEENEGEDNDDVDIEIEDGNDSDDDGADETQSSTSSDPSELDGVPDFGPAFSRRNLRPYVESSAPCSGPIRQYRGHCNVRTVKDVNYFGPDDEYVVSGSDDGNFFIWDRRTGGLVNLLEGDGEVVNVIQGHPYECMLAVSGIDHTIKIFGADGRARESARLGKGTEAHDPEGFSSLAWPTRVGRRSVRIPTRSGPAVSGEEQAAMDADYNEDYIAPNGLSSRRRMHDSYRIMQANNVERESGSEEAIISRALFARLSLRIREHRAVEGIMDEGEEGEDGEDGAERRIVVQDDCVVQ